MDQGARYDPEDIFNTDESGLYYRALPSSTLALPNDTRKEGKSSKERLPVLFTASMEGEKKALFVIGKYKSPRCFKQARSLPVDYDGQTSAWVTRSLFIKWLREWDDDLVKRKRKILLLLDNCGAHPTNVELKNIELAFLPKNSTSVLQPADQGIIRTAKVYYRKEIIRLVLRKMESTGENESCTAFALSKKISLLKSIPLLSSPLPESRLERNLLDICWRHAGWLLGEKEKENEPNQDSQELPIEGEEFQSWLNEIDDDVAPFTDEDIIANVMGGEENVEDEDEDREEGQEKIPTQREMQEALSVLQRGLKHYNFDPLVLLKFSNEVQKALRPTLKQSTINRFRGK